MAERSPRHVLFDILNAIHHVEQITVGLDEAAFAADLTGYRAVERELEIVSEASRLVSDADKAAFADIPWQQIADLGNVLRHQYQRVAPSLIWGIVADNLAPLKAAVSVLYAKVRRPADPWPDADAK